MEVRLEDPDLIDNDFKRYIISHVAPSYENKENLLENEFGD